MKTAIVFADNIKQIILTPENDSEKQALSYITAEENISLAVVTGHFGEERFKPFSPEIRQCQGGYLRVYDGSNSIMLVLTPKVKEPSKPDIQ